MKVFKRAAGASSGFTREMWVALGRVLDDADRWNADHGWTGDYASDVERALAREARLRIGALLPPEGAT